MMCSNLELTMTTYGHTQNKKIKHSFRLSHQQLHRKLTFDLDLSRHPSGIVLVDIRKEPGDVC